MQRLALEVTRNNMAALPSSEEVTSNRTAVGNNSSKESVPMVLNEQPEPNSETIVTQANSER